MNPLPFRPALGASRRPALVRSAGALLLALALSVALWITAVPGAQAAGRVSLESELGGTTVSSDGATKVSLSGSGFQSIQGGFGGIYVLFGWVGDGWRPTAGGVTGTDYRYVPDAETKDNQGYEKFVSFPGSETEGAANGGLIAADGTWATTLTIPGPVFDSVDRDGKTHRVDCREVQCGVITIGAHGVKNGNNETFTPVTFASGAGAAAPTQGPAAQPEAAADGATAAPSAAAADPNAAATPAADPAAGAGAPAAADPAALGEAQIGLVSKDITQGGALSFTAHGFLPGEQVVGTLDNGTSAAGPYLVGQYGDVAGSVPIAADLRAGTHVLTLTGAASQQTARVTFTVVSAQSLAAPGTDGAQEPLGAWDIVLIVALGVFAVVLLILLVAGITTLARRSARHRAAKKAAAAIIAAEQAEAERAAARAAEAAPENDFPAAWSQAAGQDAAPVRGGRHSRQGAALALAGLLVGASALISPLGAAPAHAEGETPPPGGGIEVGVDIPSASTSPAPAGPLDVTNSVLEWSFNDETGGGAFYGGCNFLVAGTVGDAGGSRVWTQQDGFYRTQDGAVSITKPGPDGKPSVTPDWSTKCQDAQGRNVTAASTSSTTRNQVTFAGGTGEVDLAAGTASVSWRGSATVVYYGGMTYWSFADPQLTIENGTGRLTATASGYGADMFDVTKWVKLPDTEITLATFTDVTLDDTGFTGTPEYAGVTIDTTGGMNPQDTAKSGWGSFPADFVRYQIQTGQSSYWYTSGGARDAAKPPNPVTVSWDASARHDSGTTPTPGGTGDGSGDGAGGSSRPDGSAGLPPSSFPAGPRSLDDAQLRWGLNDETTSAAFFGGCNFLVAGSVPDMGSSHVWTDGEAANVYRTSAGSVRLDRGGTAPSWADRCKNSEGRTLQTTDTVGTRTEVVIDGGTGSYDPQARTATVQWTGSFTVAFYGGMTYWWAQDPRLTVNSDGTGTLTATVGGYGADMFDTAKWVALTPRTVTLAQLSGIELSDTGISVTPDYYGVSIDSSGGMNAQDRSRDYWGAFPQDFIAFQVETGQSSYWYSSGGLRDRAKPPLPLTASLDASAPQTAATSTGPGTEATGSGGGVVPTGGAPVQASSGGGARALPATPLPSAPPVTAPVTPTELATQGEGQYGLLTPGWAGGTLIPAAADAAFGTPLRALGTTAALSLVTTALVLALKKGWLVLPGLGGAVTAAGSP